MQWQSFKTLKCSPGMLCQDSEEAEIKLKKKKGIFSSKTVTIAYLSLGEGNTLKG